MPLPAGWDALPGPVRAVHYGGADYLANANDEIVLMAMIETKEGLANLDAICATPGLDAVYIGPSDLSYALGLDPRGDNPDPVHMATCDQIRDAAHKAGINACMHCASGTFAAGAVKRGFDLVMVTSDITCMVAGPPPARRPEGQDGLRTLHVYGKSLPATCRPSRRRCISAAWASGNTPSIGTFSQPSARPSRQWATPASRRASSGRHGPDAAA